MFSHRLLITTSVLIILSIMLWPTAVEAQSTHAVRLTYWPAAFTASIPSGQFANWSTGFWSAEYELRYPSGWGMQLQWAGGPQSGWGGVTAGSTNGTDTLWGASVLYARATGMGTLHALLGYGSYGWDIILPGPMNANFTSNGFRAGGGFRLDAGRAWSLAGTANWSPSNGTTLVVTPGGMASSSDSAWEWALSVRYAPLGKWFVEGGYRDATVRTGVLSGTPCSPDPCTLRWTGWLVSIGRNFP